MSGGGLRCFGTGERGYRCPRRHDCARYTDRDCLTPAAWQAMDVATWMLCTGSYEHQIKKPADQQRVCCALAAG